MIELRNKKTGEIHEITQAVFLPCTMNKKFAIYSESEGHNYTYNSLAELNEEWEDAPEEPKEYWCIDWTGGVNHITVLDGVDKYEENKKEIGNSFETREEAERAVEKLKAWKRLKDKGFKFDGKEVFSEGLLEIDGVLPALKGADNAERLKIIDDLDLLFSGEDD